MALQKLANYHRALHGEELSGSSYSAVRERRNFLKFCAGSFQPELRAGLRQQEIQL